MLFMQRATSAVPNSVRRTFTLVTLHIVYGQKHQHAEIPRRGSAAFRFAYAQGFTQRAVEDLARLSIKRFRR